MKRESITEKAKSHPGCARLIVGIISTTFVGLGLLTLIFGFVIPWYQSSQAQSWPQVECQVIKTEIDTSHSDNGTQYEPVVTYRYTVHGAPYESDRFAFTKITGSRQWARDVVAKYPVGQNATCFYSPESPDQSVLDPDLPWWMYLVAFVPILFLFVGSGLLWWVIFGFKAVNEKDGPISSPNTLTLMNRLSNQKDLDRLEVSTMASPHKKVSPQQLHPADQLDVDWSQPKRLKPEHSRIGQLILATLVCLFWNGILSVFLFVGGGIFKDGIGFGNIFAMLFLTPFVLIGLLMIASVFYLLLGLTNPQIEIAISTGAVPLGGEFDVAWEVSGRASRFRSLKIDIHGIQSATYVRGTDRITETDIFEVIPVCDESSSTDIAFGSQAIQIPNETMHSFAGGRNEIKWQIVVQGKIPWWPDVMQSHTFRVKPSITAKT